MELVDIVTERSVLALAVTASCYILLNGPNKQGRTELLPCLPSSWERHGCGFVAVLEAMGTGSPLKSCWMGGSFLVRVLMEAPSPSLLCSTLLSINRFLAGRPPPQSHSMLLDELWCQVIIGVYSNKWCVYITEFPWPLIYSDMLSKWCNDILQNETIGKCRTVQTEHELSPNVCCCAIMLFALRARITAEGS